MHDVFQVKKSSQNKLMIRDLSFYKVILRRKYGTFVTKKLVIEEKIWKQTQLYIIIWF
jgi:hypothetical protein